MAGNVIGGGDWAKDRIIPDIIRALSNDEPIAVRNPSAIRPWQHVLEPLGGYLLLGAKMKEGGDTFSKAWNFGYVLLKDNLTVEEVVKTAITIWGHGKYDKPKQIDQPHEAGLLKLDINQTQSELGWEPKWDTAVAIDHTIKWYKDYFLTASNVMDLMVRDLNHYKEVMI